MAGSISYTHARAHALRTYLLYRHIALVLFVIALQLLGFKEILQIRHQKLKMDRMGPYYLLVDMYVPVRGASMVPAQRADAVGCA